MIRTALCLLGLQLLASLAWSSEPHVIQLWPEGVPNLRPDAAEERIENARIVGVHYPSLTVYPADPAKAVGTAVIFCPGGGYHHLTIGENGGYETQFLNEQGVTVFILKYRMLEYGQPAPLQDVLRAIRHIRTNAAEYGVQPDRIGLLGASAGGHVAASAATLWDAPEGQTGAELDAVSARPDFAMLIYPVITLEAGKTHRGSRENLLGKEPSDELVARWSLQNQVRPDMPPVFLVATMTDTAVPVENSLSFYQAMRSAKVPAELHAYGAGSHGNSLDPQYGPTARWPERAVEWLDFHGWLSKPE